MKENESTGIPITRSLMFETDDTDIHIDDQFMLGSQIMMAPIVVKGSTSRMVFFPQGQWQHLFTGEQIASPRDGFYANVECLMGSPAAYKRINVTGQLDIDFSK
jgi:alpha-glucosidase (family GH31 glycosyl hydrolase)